ncbi:hypothetical protein ACOSP7_002212 [Xanthoceras sorbifolium]
MSNLKNLQFFALDISGNNYLSWILDAEMHLQAMNLQDTVKEENETSLQDKAKAIIFLRHHLHENLKVQYLTVKDPLILWKNLKDRYDHQRDVFLPKARYDWIHLRLQDFKTVTEYNSALFKITSQLKLCGETVTEHDMLEKTFSTFHASNVLLQQQYRERRFQKYSELISCLLVAEQNNELLMKNHELRPTGSSTFPEVNANRYKSNGRGRGHGRGHGQWNGSRGRGYSSRGSYKSSWNRNTNNMPQKWNANVAKQDKGKNKITDDKTTKSNKDVCFRCGVPGHWSRTCRTPKHLVDLYQASIRGKIKEIEANLANLSDPEDITHLDIPDFFGDENGNGGSGHTN